MIMLYNAIECTESKHSGEKNGEGALGLLAVTASCLVQVTLAVRDSCHGPVPGEEGASCHCPRRMLAKGQTKGRRKSSLTYGPLVLYL